MKKRVFLIGGFNKTRFLASSLLKKGYDVTAVNSDRQKCLSLSTLEKLKVYTGDGSQPFVLEDADAYDADIAIALTGRDDDNLVICELCKKKFRVKKTVALISDPQKNEFFYRMGIDSVVCAVSAVASIIEQQAFMDEIATSLPVGEVKISQIPIPMAAPAVGKKLMELDLPKQVIVGCITRGEQSMIPRGDTHVLAGDVLVLISAGQHERAALRVLTGGA